LEREERESQRQERDISNPREQEPEREVSVWDTLDGIGREPPSPNDQTTTSDAMQRVQDRTTEQRQERDKEAAEIEMKKQEKQRLEQEQERNTGINFGF